MDEAIKINSGAVSSLADSDLVLAATSGGTYRPVSMANLLSQISKRLGVSRDKTLSLSGGEWIRFARVSGVSNSFCGILTLSHAWGSGKPCPLVCVINGASENAMSFNAEQITKGSFYTPAADNQGLSYTAIRFVIEDGIAYVEARFKGNEAKTTRVMYSLCGQINLELLDATISTASAANVLKEIDLSGG